MKRNFEISKWFIESATFPQILNEFMLECKIKDMQYFFVGLLKKALIKTYEKESTQMEYEEFKEKSCIVKLFHTW